MNDDAGMSVPTEMKNWKGPTLGGGGAIGGGVSQPSTTIPGNEVSGKSGYLHSAPGSRGAGYEKPLAPAGGESTSGIGTASPAVQVSDGVDAVGDTDEQD